MLPLFLTDEISKKTYSKIELKKTYTHTHHSPSTQQQKIQFQCLWNIFINFLSLILRCEWMEFVSVSMKMSHRFEICTNDEKKKHPIKWTSLDHWKTIVVYVHGTLCQPVYHTLQIESPTSVLYVNCNLLSLKFGYNFSKTNSTSFLSSFSLLFFFSISAKTKYTMKPKIRFDYVFQIKQIPDVRCQMLKQ